MRVIILPLLLCTWMAVSLAAQPADTRDGIGFSLEAFTVPYYYEPVNHLNGFNIGGEAKVYAILNPFTVGLAYDLSYHILYLTENRTPPYYGGGSWTLMNFEAFAALEFSPYVNVTLGLGAATYRSEITYVMSGPNYSIYTNQFKWGLSASLDVGIKFGLALYDITLRSSFSILPDYNIHCGVRNNFYFFDRSMVLFVEPGVTFWNQNDNWRTFMMQPAGTQVNTAFFTGTIGLVFNIVPFRWGEAKTKKEPERISTDKVDETKADEQLHALKAAQAGDVVTFTNIIFHSDRATIKEESTPILEQIAQFLIANPGVTVEFRGYTNYLGTPDQEQELSKARAEAVKEYMLKKGVASFRIVTIGYGSIFAQKGDITEINRRVEIRILAKSAQ